MIAFLDGEIIDIYEGGVVLLTTSGVGYEVGMSTIAMAGVKKADKVGLYIHHHQTEAMQSLFGFIDTEEKTLFTEFIKISGIGGKVALNILSLGSDTLMLALSSKDSATIQTIKGIGKKMAEKVILELKDKDFLKTYRPSGASTQSTTHAHKDVFTDVKDTLLNMGYHPRDIDKVFTSVPADMDSAGEILPYVIKHI